MGGEKGVWSGIHTIIQHEINAGFFQSRYVLPCGILIVLENELFTRVLGIPANRLEMLDVLHCHVGEKTEVLVRRGCQLTMGYRVGTYGSVPPEGISTLSHLVLPPAKNGTHHRHI
jgi:hypothetical protein